MFTIGGISTLLCRITLPVIAFFGDFQVLQHSVTNSGFLVMTILCIRTSIVEARKEYHKLKKADQSLNEIIEGNFKRFALTSREIQVSNKLMKGIPNKIIAQELELSEKTVKRHVSNWKTR